MYLFFHWSLPFSPELQETKPLWALVGPSLEYVYLGVDSVVLSTNYFSNIIGPSAIAEQLKSLP